MVFKFLFDHNFSGTTKSATSEIYLFKGTEIFWCPSITNAFCSVHRDAAPAPPHPRCSPCFEGDAQGSPT